jgi:cytochrome P450
MIAMHNDVQEKLFVEVQNVINELGETIGEEHLHKLIYLEMVIKETMRLFPVLPIHARLASEDIELEKYTIPAGANIVISVFNAHRNKNNWGDDADKFRPERFLPENYEKIHSYAFLPFSRGKFLDY